MSKNIVQQLKENNEDYEFYPTTDEILRVIYDDIQTMSSISILDIGAGNCKLLSKFEEWYKHENKSNGKKISKYYAIEKSEILVRNMPPEAIVVGGDLFQNTLIDKSASMVFCNPPYKEYIDWSMKILKEISSETIYLIIPERWKKHECILDIIEKRHGSYEILGNFDFLNSEDRKARAKIDIVKVTYENVGSYQNSPFFRWFDETFKLDKDIDYNIHRFETEQKKKKELTDQLVNAKDIIKMLVKFYDADMKHLLDNYFTLEKIDADIFKDFQIDTYKIKQALKLKIENLKIEYWNLVFERLEELTSRFTCSTREKFKKTIFEKSSIDFNEENIRNILIWTIKNANLYFNEQMLEVYDNFSVPKHVKAYKSNLNFVTDNWRYTKQTKYALDYRIVLNLSSYDYYSSFSQKYGTLNNNQVSAIEDIIVIAKNLGFNINTLNLTNLELSSKHCIYFLLPNDDYVSVGTKTFYGKIEEVYLHTNEPNENGKRVMLKNGVIYVYDAENKTKEYQFKIKERYYSRNDLHLEDDIFTTIKGYKNGNLHFQFNQKFISILNLEVGRIREWIKSPENATEEFDIDLETAVKNWKQTFTLISHNTQKLLK